MTFFSTIDSIFAFFRVNGLIWRWGDTNLLVEFYEKIKYYLLKDSIF
jgi:hypothetical protein